MSEALAAASRILAAGSRIKVRDDWPEARGPCHIRTPHYLRGRSGVVLRQLGSFPNPEDLAFARSAAVLPLYHVAFRRADIWPDVKTDDELLVEIYQHWLEPA